MEATTDAPTPNISPMPVLIKNSGAVIFTAANASLPIPLPTNIPSVITNTAEKTIPNTVGIMSQGKQKSARINVTQAVVVSSLFLALLWGVVCMFAPHVARLLGSSERLLPLAVEYMHWFLPFLVFSALLSSGMFFVRLDGSPNYAMWCNAIPAMINIVLDYVFIFIFGWEMMGAALATSLGYVVGAAMIIIYLSRKKNVIHFCRVKLSRKSMQLTWRNVKYMCRLGASTFLCEGAIACMMFAGNYVFISYLGEDGVAAFSIACYFFPIIFMVYNAIGQSAQPILSYNFGAGDTMRVRSAFRLALGTAVACGLVFFALTALFNHQIVAMFINRSYPAYDIAVEGLPLFASGFIFFAVNIVSIGYFQSVERARPAMMVTFLRGFVFMVFCLFGLPLLLKVPGIWLAVPLAEVLTFLVIMAIYYRKHQRGDR